MRRQVSALCPRHPDLQALGTPRLQEANALTSGRPSIPLSELADGRITGLLSVIDRWIENVGAHATESKAQAAGLRS